MFLCYVVLLFILFDVFLNVCLWNQCDVIFFVVIESLREWNFKICSIKLKIKKQQHSYHEQRVPRMHLCLGHLTHQVAATGNSHRTRSGRVRQYLLHPIWTTSCLASRRFCSVIGPLDTMRTCWVMFRYYLTSSISDRKFYHVFLCILFYQPLALINGDLS